MEIWVLFDGQKFTVTPERARVTVGTPVTWRFQANLPQIPRIRWAAFFNHGSPFRFEANEFRTTTQADAGQHTGATGAMPPESPGDYKYGVRAEDTATQNKLGEDDPHLIVVT